MSGIKFYELSWEDGSYSFTKREISKYSFIDDTDLVDIDGFEDLVTYDKVTVNKVALTAYFVTDSNIPDDVVLTNMANGLITAIRKQLSRLRGRLEELDSFVKES